MPAPGYGDSIGAMTIAGGIAAALLHRERTGEAHVVDVSLLGAGMWAMGERDRAVSARGTRIEPLRCEPRAAVRRPIR